MATAEAAAGVLRLRARLVHGERAATQLVLVQLRDGRLCFLVRGHFHEPEAPCPTGRHVAHDAHRVDGTELFEQLLELRLAGLVGEVSDVQFSTHLYTPCALVPSAVRRLAVRSLEPFASGATSREAARLPEAIVSRSTLCLCRDRMSQYIPPPMPPPGTMPSSTAALVARMASSTRAFFSFISVSVAAPTLITATPPTSFASRSCSFSRSYSEVVSSIWARSCFTRPSIAFLVPAPSIIVVLSLSIVTFFARPRSSSVRFSSLRPSA